MPADGVSGSVPGPGGVTGAADLVRALDGLRRRAALGSGRSRVSLARISALSGVPRSTAHTYLAGRRIPPPDVLDAIVVALGATGPEQRAWSEALERVTAAGAPPVPHLLPMAPRRFLGRCAELERLAGLVDSPQDDDPRGTVIGISGSGGVGKTALALTFAHRVADRFPDGQLWVDLHGTGPDRPVSVAAALTRLLLALGVDPRRPGGDPDRLRAAYREALTGRRVLVVLDNARDSAQVRGLLPGTAGSAAVVTSRSPLPFLAPDGSAARLEIARLAPHEARQMVGAASRPDGADELIERLLASCDGLPLALRVLAERLSAASAAEIAELAGRVDDRSRLLSVFEFDDEPSGVTAVLRSSYEALPVGTARLLRRLTLLGVPTVELAAAAAVAGTSQLGTDRRLRRLVSAGLLDRAGPRTYRVHDLVAAFAEARSQVQDDETSLTRALAGVAEHLEEDLRRIVAVIRLAAPPPGPADHTAAGVRAPTPATATADLVAVLPLIAGVAAHNHRNQEPLPVWDLLLRAFETANEHVGTAVLGDAYRRCAADAARRGDDRNECRLWQMVGIQSALDGDAAQARTAFETAVRLADRTSGPGLRADAVGNLARLETRLGRLDVALRLRERERELRLAAGDADDLMLLKGLADLHLHAGDLTRSQDVRRRILELARRDRDAYVQSVCHYHLGGLALSLDDLAAARSASAECGRTGRASGVSAAVMSARVLEAAVAVAGGDAAAAWAAIRAAKEVEISDSVHLSVDLHVVAGRVLVALGRPDEAVREHEEAVAVARRLGVRFQETIALLALARSLDAAGDRPAARVRAEQARTLAQDCGFARLDGRARDLLNRLGAGGVAATVDVSTRRTGTAPDP